MFKKALLLDSWMFPLRNEAEVLTKQTLRRPEDVLFLNCQRFQGPKNFQTMRHFETKGNILTLKDTLHYAPCDIPTVFMGSWVRVPFTWLFRLSNAEQQALPASKALGVCSDIAVRYFTQSDSLKDYLAKHDQYLIHGTSYMD